MFALSNYFFLLTFAASAIAIPGKYYPDASPCLYALSAQKKHDAIRLRPQNWSPGGPNPRTYYAPSTGEGALIIVIDDDVNEQNEEIQTKKQLSEYEYYDCTQLGVAGKKTCIHSVPPKMAPNHSTHGTDMAMLAAGPTAGACKKCKLIFLSVKATFADDALVAALTFAATLARAHGGKGAVVNLSIGYPSGFNSLPPEFNYALDNLHAAAVPVIAAAGNEGQQAANAFCYHPLVTCVGAISSIGRVYGWSNVNHLVRIFGPGDQDVLYDGKWEVRLGTSGAGALASGVAGTMMGFDGPFHDVRSLPHKYAWNSKPWTVTGQHEHRGTVPMVLNNGAHEPDRDTPYKACEPRLKNLMTWHDTKLAELSAILTQGGTLGLHIIQPRPNQAEVDYFVYTAGQKFYAQAYDKPTFTPGFNELKSIWPSIEAELGQFIDTLQTHHYPLPGGQHPSSHPVP